MLTSALTTQSCESNKHAPNVVSPTDLTFEYLNSPSLLSLVLADNQQLKLKLNATTLDESIVVNRLSRYMLLYKDIKSCFSELEKKCEELKRAKSLELEELVEEMNSLRKTNELYKVQISALTVSKLSLTQESANVRTEEQQLHLPASASDLEYKPVYRSPEEMMKTRFEILASLPVPEDISDDILKPIGIPERFTLHEFLLGSVSGSLKNALTGYCSFTENTTMWCPDREEHGFYLTPLYRCDTGPRSNVIHRWAKVDIRARMPKPTECFYKKGGEWYYTGTYKAVRLENLTPKEYDNLSAETRDALIKETLAGRKNTTPQTVFETSQLYAAGALKVAVVGIQCIGFNRMLYSVALQHAQRIQATGIGKTTPANDVSSRQSG